MKWYKHTYINKTNWIIENYGALKLSSLEGILVMIINHANENGISLSMEKLVKMSNLTQSEVDKSISLLCAKQYLVIKATAKELDFDLSGLFEAEVTKSEKVVNQSAYDLFEVEFARPLSQNELTQLSDWLHLYDQKLINLALKEASLYKKLSMPYIASILDSWSKKSFTAAMIEKGKHLEKE